QGNWTLYCDMGCLREQSRKYRELAKEYVDNSDAPAVAGEGEYAEWVKIAMLLQREEIGKPLRHCEDYLNEVPGILDVSGLEKSPDDTTFHNWVLCRIAIWRLISAFSFD